MNFSLFPEHIKLKIFSYFTTTQISQSLSPVCKEWWELCKTPRLWKKLDLDILEGKSDDVYSQVLVRCGTSLKSLTNLKQLHLIGWSSFNHGNVYMLFSNCPDIEILRLDVRNECTDYIQQIPTLKNLKSLTISSYGHVHQAHLELIIKECTKLEALILRIPNCLDSQFLLQLEEYRKETLSHLVLGRTDLTRDGITALSSFRNLRTLGLSLDRCLLNNEAFAAVSRMEKLRWLELGGVMDFEPRAWKNFFECPNLSSLKILEIASTYIDDEGVASLATTCKKLVVLNLTNNEDVHDDGVQAVIDNCSELVFLGITGSKVTNKILTDIPDKLKELKYLDLGLCSGIDESAIEVFKGMCPHVNIVDLNEDWCLDFVSKNTLSLIWQNFVDHPVLELIGD